MISLNVFLSLKIILNLNKTFFNNSWSKTITYYSSLYSLKRVISVALFVESAINRLLGFIIWIFAHNLALFNYIRRSIKLYCHKRGTILRLHPWNDLILSQRTFDTVVTLTNFNHCFNIFTAFILLRLINLDWFVRY